MISPTEFRSRFLSTLPEVPPGIDLGVEEFVAFPGELVDPLSISDADKAILKEYCLPQNVAPCLSFGTGEGDQLARLTDLYTGPDDIARYRLIGGNSYGDPICIDEESGHIVSLNHDQSMDVVYMNDSVCSLAISLCAFSQFLRDRDAAECQSTILKVDARAVEPGNFWETEIRHALEDELEQGPP